MTSLPAPIEALEDPNRRAEAERLHEIFSEVTGWSPKLWQGGKIIGYGQYHYRTKSGLEGDFLATGFNIRARDFSLHILPGYNDGLADIAARLGPHTRGKSCWYVKRLTDIDEAALRDLISAGLADLANHAVIEPT